MATKENATWCDPALEAARKLKLPQGRLRYFERQRLPDRLPERAARERQPLANGRGAALARGPLPHARAAARRAHAADAGHRRPDAARPRRADRRRDRGASRAGDAGRQRHRRRAVPDPAAAFQDSGDCRAAGRDERDQLRAASCGLARHCAPRGRTAASDPGERRWLPRRYRRSGIARSAASGPRRAPAIADAFGTTF
jgi:hypothetical protein